jgi:hypothetical protein
MASIITITLMRTTRATIGSLIIPEPFSITQSYLYYTKFHEKFLKNSTDTVEKRLILCPFHRHILVKIIIIAHSRHEYVVIPGTMS